MKHSADRGEIAALPGIDSIPTPRLGYAFSQWPVVLGAVVIAVLVAWLVTATQTERYRSSALIAVTPAASSLTPTDVARSIESLDRRAIVATVAALPGTPRLQGLALASVGITSWKEASRYRVTGVVLPSTNLVRIDAEGPDRQHAATLANRMADQVAQATRQMYPIYEIRTVSGAIATGTPVYPRLGRNLIAGLLAGLIAGAAVAWAIEQARSR